MANGANRLFKIMQKSGTDTITELVPVVVNTINPISILVDDRLIIPQEFITINDDIKIERLEVGDVLLASIFNKGQKYYLQQTANNKPIKSQVIDNLESDSSSDSLSAKQGKVLYDMIQDLQNQINGLK